MKSTNNRCVPGDSRRPPGAMTIGTGTQFYRADSMEFGFIGYYLVHNIGTYRIGFTTTDFFNIIITFFFYAVSR